MSLLTFAQQFVFAILVGALVGIEREHSRKYLGHKDIPIFGVRTTTLFSILGFLVAFTSQLTGNNLIFVMGIILAIVVSTTVYLSNVWAYKHTGATTYVTMFIVFFMGLLVGVGGQTNYVIAAVTSIVTTLLLILKHKLIGWTRKLTNEELISAIKFGIIAFIIFPLLPNKYIDPWNLINPYKIWYVIVLISAIYFVSYVLMKEFSKKGLILSAIFGGFVSSSATAYGLADWLKKKKTILKSVTSGVFAACFTGLLVDLAIIAIVFKNFELLQNVIFPFVVGMVLLFIIAFICYKQRLHKHIPESVKLESPLTLKPVIMFGGIYILLLVVGGLLNLYFGQLGLLPTTIAGSLVSAATVIMTIANLLNLGEISVLTASKFVVLAAVISLSIKVLWVHHALNKKLSRTVAIGTLSAAFLMIITLYLQLMFL
jgi:uncharacterized membrane protein (DUF4010 family)